MSASPDGRYLVGIDVVAGPKDDYGTPLAEVAVHDLVEGREVVRTSYDTAYVDGVNGSFGIDLATGEIADDVYSPSRSLGTKVSPNGRWKIRQSEAVRDEVIGSVIHGPGVGDDIGPENSASLMTCTIPEGSCRVIEESRGALIRYPNGTTFPLAMSLIGDN